MAAAVVARLISPDPQAPERDPNGGKIVGGDWTVPMLRVIAVKWPITTVAKATVRRLSRTGRKAGDEGSNERSEGEV